MSAEAIGEIYDAQSDGYAQYADERFAWLYLEQPAYDKYLPDLYMPTTKLLEVGCGNGLVARHFIGRGIDPADITGIDPSVGQIEKAKLLTPGAIFQVASAETFEAEPESLDLVVTNTVLHHLDDQQLEIMLSRIYRALKPGGSYFFVDVDPDHSKEGMDLSNQNRWTKVRTPWGTDVPFFNRDPRDLMDALDRHGFDKVSGWPLTVSPDGLVDSGEYARYSGRPSRMAARFKKMPERTRLYRVNDVRIPDLVPTPEQTMQTELVSKYFEAWDTRSPELITHIFADNAIYDEKPGIEKPLQGIEEIVQYWNINPISQQNIVTSHSLAGYSGGDSAWIEFTANFDVRGEHVSIDGTIQFTIDSPSQKITRLTEHFTTEKSPLK